MSLHEAIGRGNEEVTASPFEDGAAVNTKDANGDTPCHISARMGNTLTTQLLVNMGADLNSRDDMQRTPLYCAAINGHDLVVRVLAEAGADLTLPGGYDEDTPLHVAATMGNVGTTQLLIYMGADLDSRDGRQRTPLYCAATNGHALVVGVLMEAGADLTLRGRTGSTELTPLTAAVARGRECDSDGQLEVIRTMIEFGGADLNYPDKRGFTALHWTCPGGCYPCAINSQWKIVEVLVAAGANLEARNSYGQTPLNACVIWLYPEHIRTLLSHGADANTLDDEGSTPLHRVVRVVCSDQTKQDYLERVEWLLKAGADETMLDATGWTAAEWLEEAWNRRVYNKYSGGIIEIKRMLELLANAPTNRRWWRRGLLLMCIARNRKGKGHLLVDSHAGGANDGWSHVAAWVLDVGSEVGTEGIFRVIVEYL